MENLLILGAGGFGKVMREAACASGQYAEITFLDDNQSGIGKCENYLLPAMRERFKAAYPAFGANALRTNWVERLLAAGYSVPVFVHARAYVSPSAVLGAGAVVLPGAVVNTGCKIGRACIINIGALLDHGCTLEAGVHLAPGAIVKANNHIAANVKIESGVVLERYTERKG